MFGKGIELRFTSFPFCKTLTKLNQVIDASFLVRYRFASCLYSPYLLFCETMTLFSRVFDDSSSVRYSVSTQCKFLILHSAKQIHCFSEWFTFSIPRSEQDFIDFFSLSFWITMTILSRVFQATLFCFQ